MLTACSALLWRFPFHHPWLWCVRLLPRQPSFWQWFGHSFRSKRAVSVPQEPGVCVWVWVWVVQRLHSFLSSPFPKPSLFALWCCWLIHSPWPIISSGTGPCFPRLPISSAWSSYSETEKSFPKEMSDITSFFKLFILFLAHVTTSKFNSLCVRDIF